MALVRVARSNTGHPDHSTFQISKENLLVYVFPEFPISCLCFCLTLTALHFVFRDISVLEVSEGFQRPLQGAFVPLLPSNGHSWSLAPERLDGWGLKNSEGTGMKHVHSANIHRARSYFVPGTVLS